MTTSSSTSTSQRLLSLLSVLQTHRSWSAPELATRLGVTERTVRRDVERLRDLGYTIETVRGPLGGYRIGVGERLPPLLLDDDQALAVALALRTADLVGADIAAAAEQASAVIGRLLPSRLARRVHDLRVETVGGRGARAAVPVEPALVLEVSEAVRQRVELRFDYTRPHDGPATKVPPPRRTQPHHLLLRRGRWYVVGWSPSADDWRVYRLDRVRLRASTGPRFERRIVPGGDVGSFLEARFKGSSEVDEWPCQGEVVLAVPASRLLPFMTDATLEDLGDGRCRCRAGSWSWSALAARLAGLGAEIEVTGPEELRAAFAALAERSERAAADPAASQGGVGEEGLEPPAARV